MRIVHVVDTMEIGGAERLVSQFCRSQREQGHEPHVSCLYQVGRLGEQMRAAGFDLDLHGPASITALASRLYRHFRALKPHVVHCHNATATIAASAAAKLAGVSRVVSTRHGLVAPPYSLRRELKFAVASRFCDAVVGVCESARRNLLNAPLAAKSKVVRIYNGAERLRGDRGPHDAGSFTVVHVGRLNPVKNQALLLEAIADARARIPRIRAVLVGDGPVGPELRRKAAELKLGDSVEFAGDQSDVAPFLARGDVFVLSSDTEGLPVSLLEAMSLGLPTIVTDVGGMPEVVNLCGCGTVVKPRDRSALANALVAAAHDRERLQQQGDAAQRCYEEHFTLEQMFDQYLRLYSPGPAA